VQSSRDIRNLALIGFMGTGKSTVGRILSEQLRFRFFDTDAFIEERAGMSVESIFSRYGEAHFRDLEAALVRELDQASQCVISTGGGLGANISHLTSLKKHALVVCLWASPEGIYERVKGQTHRPLLNTADPLGKIRQLVQQREPVYKQADVLIDTELRSAREVTQKVLHHFHHLRSLGHQRTDSLTGPGTGV
jgi:shikimate kinase